MRAEIAIKFTPNENGFDRFTVTTDNGKPWLENPPVVGTNDPLRCINAVAAFLAECEGGTVEADSNRWRAEEIAKEATLASKTPESERTPEQKAIIKADADMDFAFQHGWVDFDDDPEEYRS